MARCSSAAVYVHEYYVYLGTVAHARCVLCASYGMVHVVIIHGRCVRAVSGVPARAIAHRSDTGIGVLI